MLVVGVFDYFHWGHLRLFENAGKYGSYLTVAVQDGDFILKYKPDAEILYSTKQRMAMVGALRAVDRVVVYQDVDKIVEDVDFDVFAVGEDQNHAGFQRAIQWCRENGKEVVYLSRTPGISSSDLKRNIQEMPGRGFM